MRASGQSSESRLTRIQQLDNAEQRPIIFICHSLGGIITKRVHLIRSHKEES